MRTEERRQEILAIIQEDGPLPKRAIEERLSQSFARRKMMPPSERTVEEDLKALRKDLGADILRRVKRTELAEIPEGFDDARIFWLLAGEIDLVTVNARFGTVSEDELLALELARGLLAPAEGSLGDPLFDALERLMGRLGIPAHAQRRSVLAVNRQRKERYDPGHVRELMRAIRTGRGIWMRYASAKGSTQEVIAQPLRLVLSENEWFCFAWDKAGKQVKLFKVARIQALKLRGRIEGVPAEAGAVEQYLRAGFRNAIGQKRERVVLRFSRQAWPHIRDREWGEDQRITFIDDGHGERAEGVFGAWIYGSTVWELSFVTEGISAMTPWLLQFGGHVDVIEPGWLRIILAEQTGRAYQNHRPVDTQRFPALRGPMTLTNPPGDLDDDGVLDLDG